MIALLGMVCIVVCNTTHELILYIHMHASYYSACMDGSVMWLTYIILLYAIYLNNLQVTALLEMECTMWAYMKNVIFREDCCKRCI